jgi:hypothetical protein
MWLRYADNPIVNPVSLCCYPANYTRQIQPLSVTIKKVPDKIFCSNMRQIVLSGTFLCYHENISFDRVAESTLTKSDFCHS